MTRNFSNCVANKVTISFVQQGAQVEKVMMIGLLRGNSSNFCGLMISAGGGNRDCQVPSGKSVANCFESCSTEETYLRKPLVSQFEKKEV